MQKLSSIRVSEFEGILPSLFLAFSTVQGTNVYSRLYSCLFSYIWQDLTSDPEVLETVTGQKIELGTWSKQLKLLGKPKFSEVQSESIDLEIAQLLQKGVIQPCHHEAGDLSPQYLLGLRRIVLFE